MSSRLPRLPELAAYKSSRTYSPEETLASTEDFYGESDRGAIIRAACMIEDNLIVGLYRYFQGENFDHKPFAELIRRAYEAKIIDAEYRELLELIREIRNACAHAPKPLNLSMDVLRTACEAVIVDRLPFLEVKTPEILRRAFIEQCVLICAYIQTGHKFGWSEHGSINFKT